MKKFNEVEHGYSKEEVNAFLNQVTIEYENMLNNLKSRDQKLLALNEKLKHYENIESSLNKAILVAEDASTQIKKVAHDEAKLVVEEARKNASRIVNDALLKAEQTDNETEMLKRKIQFYKRRIKQALQEQLDMVDDIDNIEL